MHFALFHVIHRHTFRNRSGSANRYIGSKVEADGDVRLARSEALACHGHLLSLAASLAEMGGSNLILALSGKDLLRDVTKL